MTVTPSRISSAERDISVTGTMFPLLSSLRQTLRTPSAVFSPSPSTALNITTRNRSQLAPRKVKYVKRHKGTIPIPIGGSTKGTTLAFGEWGIRIKGNGARFTAKQLQVAEEVIKRKLKPVKGAKIYMRLFPHLPVCVKVRAITHCRD